MSYASWGGSHPWVIWASISAPAGPSTMPHDKINAETQRLLTSRVLGDNTAAAAASVDEAEAYGVYPTFEHLSAVAHGPDTELTVDHDMSDDAAMGTLFIEGITQQPAPKHPNESDMGPGGDPMAEHNEPWQSLAPRSPPPSTTPMKACPAAPTRTRR